MNPMSGVNFSQWRESFDSRSRLWRLRRRRKVRYIQNLWDYVVADSSKVPVSDWHRHILDERLAEYHAAPDEGKP
jgi:Putative addiction module component